MLERTRNTAGNGRNGEKWSRPRAADGTFMGLSGTTATDPKGRGRSKVTNGSALFAERVNYNSVWVRRFRDLVALHVDELGGPESLGECQRSMIRRVVTLEVEMERLECKFAQEGGGSNRTLDRYMCMSNNLRRLFITLGLECKA